MSQGVINLLFIVGVILLAIEVFVIPGFGISGILGVAALITATFSVMNSFTEGIMIIVGFLFVFGLAVFLSFKFPKTRSVWKKFSLNTRQVSKEGYVAPKPQYEMYLGKVGKAVTQLRPAGIGKFDDDHLDVVTEGGYIEIGCPIKIIRVEGTRIIVREV